METTKIGFPRECSPCNVVRNSLWKGLFPHGSPVANDWCVLTNPAGLNPLTAQIIECGMAVHREFGAGMLESVYHSCFVMELQAQGLQLQTEKTIPLAYRGKQLDCDFRIDIIVEGLVVVEVKAVASVAPVHLAQVITYLKLTGCPVGLLINFNVPQLRDGVHRLVHPKLKEKK